MADCPYCRKSIDPLAGRCPHCRGRIEQRPFTYSAPTFFSAVIAPAFGAALMSLVFWLLSPFSGLVFHIVLGGARDLSLTDYMVEAGAMGDIALLAMALAALCGWLRSRSDGVALSLLSFATPILAPLVLIVAFQAVTIAGSLAE